VNSRALVIGIALAVAWAGCGLSAVGLHEDPPVPEVQVDAPGASVPETSAFDSALPPVPGSGSTQMPIGEADAGDAGDADAKLDATTDAPTTLPFEIIGPVGGAFHLVTPGQLLPCSTGGFEPATLDVKNLSSEDVSLAWVNYNCIENDYGTLGAHRQYMQPTYAGHRWRIRGAVSGTVRGDFVIDAPGTYTVIVR
jgi:hypothetical protein